MTLTEKHKEEIKRFDESMRKEIYTLREFAGDWGDIGDPSMKELSGFREVRNSIKKCLNKGFKNYLN